MRCVSELKMWQTFAKGYDGITYGMTMIAIAWYGGVRRPQRALRSWPGLLLRLGCGKRSFIAFGYPFRRNAAGGAWQTFGHLWTQWSWKARAFTVFKNEFQMCLGIPLFRHSMNMLGNSCCLSWLNCGSTPLLQHPVNPINFYPWE